MADLLTTKIDGDVLDYVLGTLALAGIVLLLRIGFHYAVLRQSRLSAETRRRWAVTIRNSLLVVFIAGMVLIWAPQLQTLAVSLFAIAVALVIATKEFIDCLCGSGLRVLTKAYAVGDRIEIGGTRGNVVDVNMLTTTVLEIGPGQTSHQYTGRASVIPNSMLLRNPVTNEMYSQDYRLHIITVPLSTDDDWQTAEKLLLEAAYEECRPFLEDAKQYMKTLEGRSWLDAPSVEPRVTYQLPEPGRINLLLRIPCPAQFPSRLEQVILRKFLTGFTYAKNYQREWER